MKHWDYHPYPQQECAGCKALTVGFQSVPGGTRPGAAKLKHQQDFDNGMHAYREAKRAGEQPEGTSVEAVRKTRQKQEFLAKMADRIVED